MKKIIIITLLAAFSVSAGEKSKEQIQKEHDAAWEKVTEAQKELEEATKRFEKQIQELIKQLKKIK